MAVILRLRRKGKKKKPYYDLVATDSRSPRDGKFIETIGAYDPNIEPAKVEINQERLQYWLKSGAQTSDTVGALIRRQPKPAATA